MSFLLENKIKSFSPNLNLEKMRELYQSIYNTIKKMPLDEVKKTMYNLGNIKFANTETGGRRNATKKYIVKTKRRKTKKNKILVKNNRYYIHVIDNHFFSPKIFNHFPGQFGHSSISLKAEKLFDETKKSCS